ncbi:XRE family transcriptional regulator [Allopusillimonas soli]|uniref:XRE family transcriptional regulator n=1 Tax=Allopusillimonas soli TaxID=659016 RepID=UPI001ADD434F|nr:XRE family transcriptional regulator [Allopusillimonas soli]
MTINLQTLGTKLSKYRSQVTQTVEEVAKATGIESSRVRSIESGVQEPTGDEILILADHYRCDFKFFISDEQSTPFEQTEILYRAHGRDFSKEDRIAIQEFLYLCDTEEFLMQELGRRTQPFSFQRTGTYLKGHGEAAAAAFRTAMGHNDRQVPRDIYEEFRSAGVHVFRRKLGNSAISGLFIMHPTAGKCALVNYSEDIYRQRFSAAHEMAHAIFDSASGPRVTYFQTQGLDMLEVRANRFASCYLMPPEVLRRLPEPIVWSEADAQRWANEFRVSCDALGIALKEAKLADARSSKRIRGYRVPRESKLDPELPDSLNDAQRKRKTALLERGLSDHYVGLCFDGYKQGVISLGRLAEALLCSRAELSELSKLYGRSLYVN